MQSQPFMFGDSDDLAAIFAVAAAHAQQQRAEAVSQMDIAPTMAMETEETDYFPAKPQRWNSCSTATTQESWYSLSSTCTPGTCTPCTPLSPIPEPRKKRVRFCVSAPQVVNTDDMNLDSEAGDEGNDIWWDEDYLLHRNKSSKKQAATYGSQHPEFGESIHALMHSYDMTTVDNAKTELQKHLRTVRNANTRGLEARIVPALKVYRWHNIQDVLMAQERLRQQGILKTPKGEQYLRQIALQVSRPARQLAFRLAQADQLDAKREHAALE